MQNLFRAFLAILSISIGSNSVLAQTLNPWKFIPESKLAAKSEYRKITPQRYLTTSLDIAQMKMLLSKSPLWRTEEAEKRTNIIVLPMPDGSFKRFKVVEAPIMHPDLQAQFPEIRCYTGQGMDDPLAYFKGDLTPLGFHGMIRHPEHSTVYIDPYTPDDSENYQVYFRKDYQKEVDWVCGFDETEQAQKPLPNDPSKLLVGDCQLREYVLALACTGEYSVAVAGGGTPTVAISLAAMTTTMNRVNGVFELETSIHMTFHPNTSNLIYLNGTTDPYDNSNTNNILLTQNQTNCNTVIGNANYDIGHVFSTGGGGVATLGCVCDNTLKARGVTGRGNPTGDAFDIDYVAHEMGHQFGATHTFNDGSNGSCAGGNRSAGSAYEPGSGTTIMAYAGICSPQNVQSNSDDYFHAISLSQIAAEVTNNATGGGNTCSTNSSVNSAPTANAGPDYVVPRSTPFILTGSGTDPNPSDVLTYTWEQMDLGAATSSALTSTLTSGPVFRSFKGTTSPSRYVPRLIDLANNTPALVWEVLPSVARTLNFRLTVKDNHIGPVWGGGCTAEDNMVVTVNGTAGPFLVTAPNTAVSWVGGSQQTVTWDVASTNLSPINCASVDVLMSVDGGLTYPYTLLVATPNDGSQVVGIPNVGTTTARIMVKANGNIFYDISNANFTITTGSSSFSITSTPTNQTGCVPSDAIYSLNIGSIGGFGSSINLAIADLPSGASATFSPNPVVAPGTTTLTIATSGASLGSFNPMITGTSGALSISRNIALTTATGVLNPPTLISPANQSQSIGFTPTLNWGAISGSTSYQVQVSTSSSFTTTVLNVTGILPTSYSLSSSLNATSVYYWRVRAVNICGNGTWSVTNYFTTGCSQTLTNSTVVNIGSGAANTINSTLTVSGLNGNVIGIKIKDLKIHHTWVGDVRVTLKSPANVSYILFDRPGFPASTDGCSNRHILVTLDDAALLTASDLEGTCNTSTATTPPPYAINGTYKPVAALSGLNGTSPNGIWTLTVEDLAAGDGGSLQSWGLEIVTSCSMALQSKLFLSNEAGGIMDDYLRQIQVIPLNDPYADVALPYYNSGNFIFAPSGQLATTTQTILDNNLVVDWVFVELRSGDLSVDGFTTVVASKSGLLTRDGTVINPDGSSFSFTGLAAGSYYIAIKHRNHAGFMTETKKTIPTTNLLDFTNGSVTFYEPNNAALREVFTGVYAMWAGDTNLDFSVDGGDVTLARNLSGSIVDEYHQVDANIDGSVDGGDVTIIRGNSGSVSQQID